MRARFWLVLLVLSACLNLLLAVWLCDATRSRTAPALPPSSVPDNPLRTKTNVVVRRENFTWDMVQSTNYATLIRNLRAIGCPEQTIRDIVSSEVNRTYARRRVTEVNFPNFQWWKSVPDQALVDAATAKLQGLETERRDLLTGLLGEGWDAESKVIIAARAGMTLTGPILGDMPDATKQAVLDIIAAGQQKIEAYQESQRLQGKAIDPMQMIRLREDPLVQLASVLDPEQYDEFTLRYSPAAQQLRDMMRNMEVTPDGFRTLFSGLSSIIGQPVFYYAGSDPQLLKQQQQLLAQSDAVIKATLGGPVYTAYQLNQDPVFRSSQALAQQLSLPQTVVQPIYEINRATQAELDRIRKDDALSNDEKVEAMAQTQVQQQQSLQQLMGPAAFERWLQGAGASK